jgi:hypothetical protein
MGTMVISHDEYMLAWLGMSAKVVNLLPRVNESGKCVEVNAKVPFKEATTLTGGKRLNIPLKS